MWGASDEKANEGQSVNGITEKLGRRLRKVRSETKCARLFRRLDREQWSRFAICKTKYYRVLNVEI
jgi:hypothetical protein